MRIQALSVALLLSSCVSADPAPCRYVSLGAIEAGAPPLGRWSLAWQCLGNCDQQPPPLTEADAVTITPGHLTWSRGNEQVDTIAVHAEGACWVSDVEPGECRSVMRLCAADGDAIDAPLAWFDTVTGIGQVWDVSGHGRS